jgi:molecular chaperone GrpE
MPEPTPPPDAGGAAGRGPRPLTPDAIDAVLADFRRWLEDLAASAPEPPPEPEEPAVDLATVVAAFTALRHEVNLQTKAARAQSEQFAHALDALRQQAPARADEVDVRPFVNALAEAYDALTRAGRELGQLHEGLTLAPVKPTFLDRLFARGVEQRSAAVVPERLMAAAVGLRMSEKRVERLMSDVGLVPVECAGRPFDPEAMEAVEAVAESGQPPGAVIEEVRRGYRWRGRVFRYAQVRVAR